MYWPLFWLISSAIGLHLLHALLRNILYWNYREQLSFTKCYIIATRCISGMQAIVISFISLRAFIICKDIMYDREPVLDFYIYPMSAYFIYDLIVMYGGHVALLRESGIVPAAFTPSVLAYVKTNLFIVIHRVLMEMFGLPVAVFFRRGLGTFFMAGFFMAEFSTPFHNIRGVQLLLEIKDGFYYNLNGLLFLVSFFLARVCMVPYMYYRYAVYVNTDIYKVPARIPWFCNVGSGLFLMLQCYWFTLIFRRVVLTVKSLRKHKEHERLDDGGRSVKTK